MKRLTTDNPQGTVQTMMNMVYGKGGWQYIRYGEPNMATTDFALHFCKKFGCDVDEISRASDKEEKDEWLCTCDLEDCPVAAMYAALCGFGHVRGRLKKFEDERLKEVSDED